MATTTTTPAEAALRSAMQWDAATLQRKEAALYARFAQPPSPPMACPNDADFAADLALRAQPHARRPAEPEESKFSDDEMLRTRTVLLTGTDPTIKREEIRAYFHKTFSLYEHLFEVLIDDDTFYEQPEKLRHPLVFYFGHTAVFFINKLMLGKLIHSRIDESIESTCAVGVDEMSWDDLNSAHYNWPTIAQLRTYRDQTRCLVDSFISKADLSLPVTWQSQLWPILMGIEHERIHLETSSVLFRQLPIERVRPHRMWTVCPHARTRKDQVPANYMVPVPGGRVSLGRTTDSPMYGWDNEYGEHDADVATFEASAFLVSNAEWLEFMQDGGYTNAEWWGEEGWRFVTYKQATHPVFWVPVHGASDASGEAGGGSNAGKVSGVVGYRYRSMTMEHDMPWDWPVDVNYIEAKAFCRWKSARTGRKIRLPTEEEWVRMRDLAYPEYPAGAGATTAGAAAAIPGEQVTATPTNPADCTPVPQDQPYWPAEYRPPFNVNLEHWASSSPIDMFAPLCGLYDVMGNVWQHTETPIAAFKGFRFHPLYDDFSVPTFDTRHNMIKGGSWISTGNEATRLCRYAFRRHFYQHAGFRYVESDVDVQLPSESAMTETDPIVCQSIHAQYASVNLFGVPNFIVAMAQLALAAYEKHVVVDSAAGADTSAYYRSALDLGCGAGRAAFELARKFEHVHGLDNTTRFVRVASQLQFHGALQYCLRSEGELETFHEVDAAPLDLPLVRDHLEFMQADACNLDPKYAGYNLVLAANLIESVYSPSRFLSAIHAHMRPGGLLVLASTYRWDAHVTKKEEWLGGKKEHGESLTTLDALERILSAHFTRVGGAPVDVPCMTRLDARNYVHSMSQVTLWVRKE